MKYIITIIWATTLSFQSLADRHEEISRACKKVREGLGVNARLTDPHIASTPLTPSPARSFLAQESDKSGIISRNLNQILTSPNFTNYRGRIRHAHWDVHPEKVWDIRNTSDCLQELDSLGIRYETQNERDGICGPIANPIKLAAEANIAGVIYQSQQVGRKLIFSCELVTRLVYLSDVLKRHGITKVNIMSSWRKGRMQGDRSRSQCRTGEAPVTSLHTAGLAIDIQSFENNQNELIDLYEHYYSKEDGTAFNVMSRRSYLKHEQELTSIHNFLARKTSCHGTYYGDEKAQTLQKILCEVRDLKIFATSIGPNYNCGHRDHFHFDIRPQDPRFFTR